MVIFTSLLIENAACPPGKAQLIFRCSQLKGCGLRVIYSCSKGFVVEFRKNGSITRITIAKANSIALDAAREQVKIIIKSKKNEQHPKHQEPVITLGEIFEEYLHIRRLRPASLRSYRNVTKQRLGDWLCLPVTDITKQMIMQRHWDISNVSGKYQAVVALRSDTVRDLLLLVLFTGLRRTEAMSLSWSDIDFESKVLTVRAGITKNHKEHRLPLSTFLYGLLRRRKEASKSEWVFPGGHLVQCSEVMDQVRNAAGIKFGLHDLRRSFLTLAERLDLPYYVLKRLANHSGSQDVTFGYIIPNVERLRKPMQQISEKLVQLMNAEEFEK